MLTVLDVRLCKPAIYKLKILGKGKFEYYKLIGGGGGGGWEQKGGPKQVFKINWGGDQKGADTIFDLNLVGGGRWNLGGNYVWKILFCNLVLP